MLRKLLLAALALGTLAGCATGYGYRAGYGDYYYGWPGVEYRYYGDYGYAGFGSYGYGEGYYFDVFGRPLRGYPYGYYGGRYPGYPYWHVPRPRHDPGHGHGGEHDRDHQGPPRQDDHHPGNRPPWRDIGHLPDREGDEPYRPRRFGPPEAQPRMQAPAVRASVPVVRERSESRPAVRVIRGGGSGQRSRVRVAHPSAHE